MTKWVTVEGYKIDYGRVFAVLASHTEVGAYVFVAENIDEEEIEYQIDPKTFTMTGYNMDTDEELDLDQVASPELLDFILNHEAVKRTANPKWIDVAGYRINDTQVHLLTVSISVFCDDDEAVGNSRTKKESKSVDYVFYTFENGHEIKYIVDSETFEVTRWFEINDTSLGIANEELTEYLLNHPNIKEALAELDA
ncbi:hypothetical protein [Paenibacillus flagellatus]|uniref:Uncharacterized protein n=1 Tax=Paenibacillus flagellatus TaxID=2211139 RepID=A0A2V5KIE4_9BACL|nr:hypothetical protein [Paenibacillus flagellatus]PYI49997.1 hypothetical protein DLM86_31310 [Paenibacillus flagellatus]